MRAVVVGAGIGGLTAALALRAAGLEVEVVGAEYDAEAAAV
jgi:phytoene dehydrogenase-like protein